MELKALFAHFSRHFPRKQWMGEMLLEGGASTYHEWLAGKVAQNAPGEGEYMPIYHASADETGFIIRFADGEYKAEEWRKGDIVDNFYSDDFRSALMWIDAELNEHLQWREDAMLERLIESAEQHGMDSEPQHQVGDLEDYLRAMWRLLTQEQRRHFFGSADVASTFEGALGEADPLPDEADLSAYGLRAGAWYENDEGFRVRPMACHVGVLKGVGIFEDSESYFDLGAFKDQFRSTEEV
ncbi:hypothetical protein [Cupriavidus sp. TMH.W2]|uniref:hypothetical protein n=1 Tax=Cupriavidus sp. TMH.W2 TaxID=3434465 RepID=UPI003D774E1A